MIARIQRRMIYRPLREAVRLDARAVPSGIVREVQVATHDGLRLHGWHATSKYRALQEMDGEMPTIIFFPGNSGHRGCRQRDLELFTQIGVDLLLVDYRGYAENPGRPSEAALAADARAIWRFATEELGKSAGQLVLFGASLGGGVATGLAHELCETSSPPSGLILRSTFTSLADVGRVRYPWLPVQRWLVDRFPSLERIARITCPLMVMHGARDRIVPISQGRRLFEAAPVHSHGGVRKRFVEFPQAGHNDVIHTAWAQMQAAVLSFLADVTSRLSHTSKSVSSTP